MQWMPQPMSVRPPSVAVFTPAWQPVFALIFSTFVGMISGRYLSCILSLFLIQRHIWRLTI